MVTQDFKPCAVWVLFFADRLAVRVFPTRLGEASAEQEGHSVLVMLCFGYFSLSINSMIIFDFVFIFSYSEI